MLRRLSEGQKRNIAHWAMEFVVVVAGVLLALWLQELANDLSRRADAERAEAAIRDEVDENLMGLVALQAMDVCRRDRLREIDRVLQAGGNAAPLLDNVLLDIDSNARISNQQRQVVYGTLNGDLLDTAWQSANASGTLSAVDPARYRALANLYATFALIQQTIETHRNAAAKLQLLAYGTPLTPEVRASLVEAQTIATQNWAFFHDAGPAFTPRGVATAMKDLGWDDRNRMDALIRRAQSEVELGFPLKPCHAPFKNPFG
jgi:hypothetical protein